MINRLMWIWRGVTRGNPRCAGAYRDERGRAYRSELYDTVVGYRGGNWIFEWAKQAMLWQQKAGQEEDPAERPPLAACGNLYSIAAYPHIKGDELAEQAQALANRAYEEAAQRLPGQLRELEFTIPAARRHRLFAYAERRWAVPDRPDVRRAGFAADDYYSLYENYFAPLGSPC
jgi:esterase FrsA